MAGRRRKAIALDDALWVAASWFAALLWAAARPAFRWAGVNGANAVVNIGVAIGRGGLAVTVGAVIAGREKAREIGEHGGQVLVDCGCGCGERMTLAQFDRHLAAIDAETTPRVEVPAGTRKLEVTGPPRQTLAEAVPQPRRRPQGWEVECPYCHDWIGARRLWPVHAEVCNAAQAVKQQRIIAALNWRWHNARDGLSKTELAQIDEIRAVDPLPWVDVLPVKPPVAKKDPQPAAGGGATTKGIAVQDPRNIVKAADAFADPAIDAKNWENELLEFLRLCAHVEVQLRERIAEGMVVYMTKAEVSASVVQHLQQVAVDHDAAAEHFLKARDAAAEWIESLKTPFAKV
jgi:hypothetical protein